MKEEVREYSMSDADLAMFVSNLAQSMTRDAAEFANYGVDAAAITAFEALGDSFEVFPPDTFYQAEVTIAVEDKNASRESLINDTHKIANRALVKWGENSGHYKKFGVKNILKSTDKALLATARLVAATAAEYLTELTPEGLTQQIIDDYIALAQTYEDNMNAVNAAVETRDSKTQERIELGNELYAQTTKNCTIGKTIWDKVDEAKYNDYLIYSKGPLMPGKVQNMAYDLPTFTVSWDAAPNTIDYQLEFKPQTELVHWDLIWEGLATSQFFNPGVGSWHFRCRGHNDQGYGDWSDVLLLPQISVDTFFFRLGRRHQTHKLSNRLFPRQRTENP